MLVWHKNGSWKSEIELNSPKTNVLEVQVQEFDVPTKKGHSLGACKFMPEKAINHVLVISSATGVLQRYYAKFANFIAANGIPVYTFDYHGIGKSAGSEKALRNNSSDLIDWGQNDQAAVVALAKKECPNSKLVMVAHSIGGQLLGLNPNFHMIDKVILVASQSGYWKHFNGFHSVKMLLFWYGIIPLLTPIFGFFPAKKLGLFENLPKRMAYQWASWGKQPGYLMHFFNKQDYHFDKFDVPLLSLSFSKDTFAPVHAVDWLTNCYKNTAVHRVHHPSKAGERHLKHFGFFKSWAQEQYWTQCLNYITNGTYTA